MLKKNQQLNIEKMWKIRNIFSKIIEFEEKHKLPPHLSTDSLWNSWKFLFMEPDITNHGVYPILLVSEHCIYRYVLLRYRDDKWWDFNTHKKCWKEITRKRKNIFIKAFAIYLEKYKKEIRKDIGRLPKMINISSLFKEIKENL